MKRQKNHADSSQNKVLFVTLFICILALIISIAGLVILLLVHQYEQPQSESTTVSAIVTTESQMSSSESTSVAMSAVQTTFTIAATTVTTTTTTITTTTMTTEPPITVCTELSSILENHNYTLEELENSKQLIAVVSSGSSCTVYGFSETGGNWATDFVTSGCVGKNGVSAESREGDYRTPKGLFPLGFAFGTENLTDLSIPYRQLNENCYWVDDPESQYYNQWQETTNITWNSAEHLIDYATSYRYTVVVNYNMNPIVPYKGSAIFLHCATGSYTAGCIAVPTADMREILYWLKEDANPMILIC
ncbi:MAG: L,D-transpeptidase family protein [Oscillospiraceae bacterium]|nr:L,D-transpeptidase family protein [Oscillospiraceae bacterium]